MILKIDESDLYIDKISENEMEINNGEKILKLTKIYENSTEPLKNNDTGNYVYALYDANAEQFGNAVLNTSRNGGLTIKLYNDKILYFNNSKCKTQEDTE